MSAALAQGLHMVDDFGKSAAHPALALIESQSLTKMLGGEWNDGELLLTRLPRSHVRTISDRIHLLGVSAIPPSHVRVPLFPTRSSGLHLLGIPKAPTLLRRVRLLGMLPLIFAVVLAYDDRAAVSAELRNQTTSYWLDTVAATSDTYIPDWCRWWLEIRLLSHPFTVAFTRCVRPTRRTELDRPTTSRSGVRSVSSASLTNVGRTLRHVSPLARWGQSRGRSRVARLTHSSPRV